MELRCGDAMVLLTILLMSEILLKCLVFICVEAGTVGCITCYRQKDNITITMFCSYGCCLEDETTACCDKSIAGPLSVFVGDLSGLAVIGLVVAFTISLCIVVALVCCCVKKHTQSRRVDTTTNVSFATVTSHQPRCPVAYSPSALIVAEPSYSGYTSYPPSIPEYRPRQPYVTSTSITTVA